MKLIKPSFEILSGLSQDSLQQIELAARTCYKSEDRISEGSAKKLVGTLIERNHGAMLEFHDVAVKFVCDRGVSHEIVRHRIASFAQESTRYCNYSKDKFGNELTFIIPNWLDYDNGPTDAFDYWAEAMKFAEDHYIHLINDWKWSPQEARSVLPNSLKTEIVMKTNLRSWRNFFQLRCNKAAHPQMRELAVPLLDRFQAWIPLVFDDITY
jgi:thymidylate synthase (FAD)